MFTNRLAKETSPYLLQHAHNPVDWFPWGDEAIKKARDEDKPMLVSIGYSACHWCHVMERESFEDPETAALMNREFVNIKIDREERPDLDHIYMDALQAIAGNGGWPLNVFLTPEAKPFYGGTYFPPVNVSNRASWKSVLQSIANAFRDQRQEIEKQADQLTNHIAGSGFKITPPADTEDFSIADGTLIFEQLMKTADRTNGGFGAAPKFPQTFSIRFLFQHHYYYNELSVNQPPSSVNQPPSSVNHPPSSVNQPPSSVNPPPSTINHQPSTIHHPPSAALNQACLSLDKMIFGGIYDQLGGGFSRYSTDSNWLAPHFEKMLYDNALLITTISEAYQITGKAHYRRAVSETMDFIQRELKSPIGGFYSALDADSEGEEGKFYVWQKNDLEDVLGKDSATFCKYYDVTEHGNWEEKNILRILHPDMDIPEEKIKSGKKKLMESRSRRVRPQLDDKILLGWNALLITACCKAFAALGETRYRDQAMETMDFMEKNMKGEGLFHFYHSYKEGNTGHPAGRASIPAFLDDYAYLIEAYIQLQEITGNGDYLIRAELLADWVIQHFSEAETGYFYYTHEAQDDVIVRKREIYDGAVPSGNAVMAANLFCLGTVFDRSDWKERALQNVRGLREVIKSYPGSFGVWATLLNAVTYQLYEIALTGSELEQKHREFLGKYVPNRVFQLSSERYKDLPLLRNKPVEGSSQFFLCRDYSCQKSVKHVNELILLLKNS